MTRTRMGRMHQGLQLLVFLLLGSLCPPLRAQVDVSAQLIGTVTDSSGAMVPNAEVEANHIQTGFVMKTVSDGSGNYKFLSLPAGTYTVSCTMKGFKKFVAADITLQVQRISTLSIVLEVGATTETVEVSASAEMVNTTAATVQTTYDSRLLDVVPVQGRDSYATLRWQIPGIDTAGNVNGVRQQTNNVQIDGSDANNYFGGGYVTTTPAVENISEMSIITSVPDASFGRAAGVQLGIVMKSGTNEAHGQLWGYFQQNKWNANSWERNWRGMPKAPGKNRWYGGNVGGPVYVPRLYNGKNKTFFFASYERNKIEDQTLRSGQTISNEERDGIYTNSWGGIPVLDGIPSPIIPVTRFAKMGQYLRAHPEFLPRPTFGENGFTWDPWVKNSRENFIGKIDHNFSDRHRLFGSLWWTKQDDASATKPGTWAYPNPATMEKGWLFQSHQQVWTLNDTYTISPRLMNNFIFSGTWQSPGMNNNYDPSKAFTAQDLGVNVTPDAKAAYIMIVYTSRTFGDSLLNGYVDDMHMRTFHVADNVSYVRGRHTMKMGFEVRRYHETKYQDWRAGGDFGFYDGRQWAGGTGNAYADYFLGKGAFFGQVNAQDLSLYYPANEAYFQDTFKLTPRFTLMFGARWQPQFGVYSAKNDWVTFRPGQVSTMFPTAPVGLVVVGDRGVDRNLYGTRWGNIGPRFSFAWDIFGNGRASLRGGYGWMTDYQMVWAYNNYTNSAPYGVGYYPIPNNMDLSNIYAQYGKNPFPWKEPAPGDPNNASIVFPKPLDTLGFADDFNSAQIHHFNATLQFEPVKTYLFSVGFVGTRSTHLQGTAPLQTRDINYPRFVPGASSNDAQNKLSRRPYYQYGFQTISTYISDYNAFYKGLQTTFTNRLSHGLTFQGNYTLWRNTQQNRVRDWSNASLDYFSPGLEQRFATTWSYDLPIPTGSSRLSRIALADWTLGGSMIIQTGSFDQVYWYDDGGVNFGSAQTDALFLGGSPYSTNKLAPVRDATGTQIGVSYLNASKFIGPQQLLQNGVVVTNPEWGKRLLLGNATIGTWRRPRSFSMDLTLRKEFAVTERVKTDVRISAFNALNHVNLNGPGNYTLATNNTSFGVINSSTGGRAIQASVRVRF